MSLLALLLLVLASQAAADHKGNEDDGDDEAGGDDGTGSRRDKDADDGRDRWDDEDDDDEDDGDERDHDGDDAGDDEEEDERRDRKSGHGKGRDRERDRPSPGDRDEADSDSPRTGPTAPIAPIGDGARDTGVEILPTALPGRVQFSFLITSADSTDAADGVTFEATLPDTGNSWSLAGPSVDGCRLEGPEERTLDCSFHGLAPGDVRLVQATSPLGRAPPWELVAEGAVLAPGDEDAGNDRARAGLGLLLA